MKPSDSRLSKIAILVFVVALCLLFLLAAVAAVAKIQLKLLSLCRRGTAAQLGAQGAGTAVAASVSWRAD